jgi:hypothetical protein
MLTTQTAPAESDSSQQNTPPSCVLEMSGVEADNIQEEPHTKSYIYTYLSTAIGLTPSGSSTVLIYTQTTHRTTQITNKTTQIITNLEECWPCPVFAGFTLAFALQLRKKHG